MKDIKIKTGIAKTSLAQSNPNKSMEKVFFSVFLFGFMLVSLISYIFLISSSVFYSIKSNKYMFKTQNINRIFSTSLNLDSANFKVVSSRISYINKDSDNSISLK